MNSNVIEEPTFNDAYELLENYDTIKKTNISKSNTFVKIIYVDPSKKLLIGMYDKR